MTIITSLQNRRVKEAIRLRERRGRQKQGRILIEGVRELSRAIEAGVDLREVFVSLERCTSDQARGLLATLAKCEVEVLEVAERVLARLSFGNRAEGVLGVAATPPASLGGFEPSGVPLVAVLEGVEKPGNVGAVLRSADAAGLGGLIVADGRTDLFNPNTIRASLGTVFTLPLAVATTAEAIDWLRRRNLAIYAARTDGSTTYTQADYRGPTAIVLGSEAEGLSSTWSADDVRPVRLPMLGEADSLNISAAAAVLFYEALRQRSV